jgi:hypothetical protein
MRISILSGYVIVWRFEQEVSMPLAKELKRVRL